MEGFLLKKGFATRFNRRWFVLDQQYLTYYETFDQGRDEPINLRGVLQLRNAEIVAEPFKNRPNVLRIRTQEKRTVHLDCEDSNYKETWLSALREARVKHTQLTSEQQFERSLKLLEIPPDKENITERDIVVAYKKASLRLHPDKGGNVDEFNTVKLAYNQAKEFLENRNFRATAKVVEYEALVEKGGAGVGIGLIVTEEPANNEIVVVRVTEKCILRGLSEEADGSILPDDILIGINNDDTTGWNLTRLKARMNNFRAPVGTVLRLSFRRYVRQSDGDDSSSVARMRAREQADKQRRVEEQLGSENLEAPLRILLINNELDGGEEEDDDNDVVNSEWIGERKVLRKEVRRLSDKLAEAEATTVISRGSDNASVVPSTVEIELRRELELLRNRCLEYDNAATQAEERIRFQQNQIDSLVIENAQLTAELAQLGTVRQTNAEQALRLMELEELRHNYRRVIADLHDAEEKVRELDRQLLAESQFREAVKATFAANDQTPAQAAQEVMEQVAMLQRERDAAIRERHLYRQLLYKKLQQQMPKTDGGFPRQGEQSQAARLQALVEKYAAALRFD